MKKLTIALSSAAVALIVAGSASAQVLNQPKLGVTASGGISAPGGNFVMVVRPFYQTSETFNIGLLGVFNNTESTTMLIPEGQVDFATETMERQGS